MITKRRGEKWHPFLKPLDTLNKGPGSPFRREAIQGEAMQDSIQAMKF
jgi:hypothetical protein